jgi:hypothetical protein
MVAIVGVRTIPLGRSVTGEGNGVNDAEGGGSGPQTTATYQHSSTVICRPTAAPVLAINVGPGGLRGPRSRRSRVLGHGLPPVERFRNRAGQVPHEARRSVIEPDVAASPEPCLVTAMVEAVRGTRKKAQALCAY